MAFSLSFIAFFRACQPCGCCLDFLLGIYDLYVLKTSFSPLLLIFVPRIHRPESFCFIRAG